uniref:Zona occludens toxin N-terminal domain-containing protein n=1 Tax=Spongospora subterranea TaxID=70186 RepID=A0A0H5R565_9EUKA|eukprot:CRZ08947.1 hypothetical protein [Spongospora subterranea]
MFLGSPGSRKKRVGIKSIPLATLPPGQTRREEMEDVTSLVDKIQINEQNGRGHTEGELTPGDAIQNRFFSYLDPNESSKSNATLCGKQKIMSSPNFDHGLLGMTPDSAPIFLNTSVPFTAIAVGVQGSGKSHSLSVIMESCLINYPPVIRAHKPCAALVFHYDTDQANYCEVAFLTFRSKMMPDLPVVKELVILVSPAFFTQRSKFYRDWPNCTVRPLLFRWRDLTAGILLALMQVDMDKSPPLYLGALLDLLRKLQKKNEYPTFQSFKNQLSSLEFTPAQLAPLTLRLQLIESLLSESTENVDLYKSVDLEHIIKSGTVVICDMTDPMMTAGEARGIFEVVLEKFRTLPTTCGKLAVFDEAHKYMKSEGNDRLSETIIELSRQMRHHGMRIVVSSQSPATIPAELIELSSICIVHKFFSRDWFNKLQAKMPLTAQTYEQIVQLDTGHAIVFSGSRSYIDSEPDCGQGCNHVMIRNRLTADGGTSKVST